GALVRERRIPCELIQKGDLLRIAPGDRIPTDGTVRAGASSVDESMVTGEACPVAKQPGSTVIGGTVNGAGTLSVEATRVGAETPLAQIVRLVENAQPSKPPIQQFADTPPRYFVPAVLSLSATTFCVWMLLCLTHDLNSLPPIFHNLSAK